MVRKGWIDKKTASHFTVVHRQQNDPLIHDDSAPAIVLNPTAVANTHKVKKLDDLASEFGGSDSARIRDNEGEAANYGVYYDDTEYDYMQHMRDIGTGDGTATWLEAPSLAKENKSKGKGKAIEDMIKDTTLEDRGVVLDDEILPSKNLRKITYQAMQQVPDALAGFQPDMDPRLREVLEALEDEAYVDDDDDIFGELAKDGEELDDYQFEDTGFDDEQGDGWESDATIKADEQFKHAPILPEGEEDDDREDHGDGDWLANFSKFKKDQKAKPAAAPSQSDMQSSLFTTTTNGGRKKKRKGALTNPSTYSMSSSALVRTEGHRDLDDRYGVIEESYMEDVEDMSEIGSVSAISTSSVTGPMRGDFDDIMSEFLGNYHTKNKKYVKKGKYQDGMEQLDEVRKGLGPARRPNRA